MKVPPLGAALGTGTTILVSVHVVGMPATPPKVTVLPLTWLAPKFWPLIVTAVPTGPCPGNTLVIPGKVPTRKYTALLVPLAVVGTTICPVLEPDGMAA